MNNINDPCDYIEEVKHIAEPLARFGISNFTYQRKYHNEKQFYLSANSNWTNEYLSNYSKIEEIVSNYLKEENKTEELNMYSYEQNKIYKYIDNRNQLFLLIFNKTYYEVLSFSGREKNKQLKFFYLNNFDIFDAFTIYFKDRASHILKRLEKGASIISGQESNITTSKKAIITHDPITLALKEMKIQQYKLNKKNTTISIREIECLAYYEAGLTAKETAKMLNLSFRTIERYFDNMKAKLRCNYKRDLIKILINAGFPKNILKYYSYENINV